MLSSILPQGDPARKAFEFHRKYRKTSYVNKNPMHYSRNAWDVRYAVPPSLLIVLYEPLILTVTGSPGRIRAAQSRFSDRFLSGCFQLSVITTIPASLSVTFPCPTLLFYTLTFFTGAPSSDRLTPCYCYLNPLYRICKAFFRRMLYRRLLQKLIPIRIFKVNPAADAFPRCALRCAQTPYMAGPHNIVPCARKALRFLPFRQFPAVLCR